MIWIQNLVTTRLKLAINFIELNRRYNWNLMEKYNNEGYLFLMETVHFCCKLSP